MANARKKLIHHQPPPKTDTHAHGKVPPWRLAGLCLLLAVITFAAFGQTLHYDFVNFDDNDYVYENPVVAQGLTLKGIGWAFTAVHADNWHPLTWLSHMLDCQLYGLHPGGHHLTNVLLHTATVIALFLVLRQMTGALWRSAFVAAVFAIHPLRVESVAWVAERKDVLSGLFFMLTIGAYVRYARHPGSWRRYGMVLLVFALGLMSKPMLVTLPLVLLLLDYWPLQRKESTGKLALEKLPLLALSAGVCVVTLFTQAGAIQHSGPFALPLRLENALMSSMVYLGQIVWPAGLAAYYPYPRGSLPMWLVALTGALLAGLSVVVWAGRRKQPWLLTGWLWYLIMLLPVVGIVQAGLQSRADRYTYLPQIGIYVALTWLAAESAAKWQAGRVVAGSLAAGVLALLMACTWKQTAYWRDGETLWRHALDCTTNNYLAEYNLGSALLKEGKLSEATSYFQKAVQIQPDSVEANVNFGIALMQMGNMDEAIPHFQTALQVSPASAEAHSSLGIALFQKGKVDEAIDHFQSALQSNPAYAEAHVNLGIALFQRGKVDEAIGHFQRALQVKPDDPASHYYLGTALLQKGDMGEAISEYQKSLQLKPDNPEVQNNLAWLLVTCPQPSLRNGERALQLSQQACALSGGNNPIFLRTLAAAYAELGRFGEAKEIVQKAIELAQTTGPQDLPAHLNGELKRYEAGLPVHQ